jgi:glycosyltransferase involved in cell wall biosynthesis
MSSPEPASAILRRAGLNDGDFQVSGVPAAEVPALLRRARLGISFRKPTFSQIAASPTKISEYLAGGLATVSNQGIGDTDELLEGERIGIVVRGFDRDTLARAAEQALALAGESGIAARCRAAAKMHFDLGSVGGARYLNVYRRLGG